VSGLNQAGQKVGSSPIQGNNSSNILIDGCNLHDSFVSSLTFSSSGAQHPSTITTGITVRNTVLAHNANTASNNGKAFPAANHEGFGGQVLYENVTFQTDNPTWVSAHLFFGNSNDVADCPTILIREPIWSPLWPAYNGCFVVHMPANYGGAANRQTTPPKVVKGGVTLTPYVVNTYSNNLHPVDPTKQFILLTSN
jgi:hypothetical protein